MTKQYSLLLGCLLSLGITAQACESDIRGYNYGESLEEQLNTLLKNNPENPSLLFNQFIHMQVSVLLNGPDSIEELNKQMRASGKPIPGVRNSFICDSTLNKNLERIKRKYTALFDFVRKHQGSYTVNSQLLTDLKTIEEFAAPIKSELGIRHNGQTMTANEFLASDADPAEKESFRIGLFENCELSVLPSALDRLPSEQAIRDLPKGVQKWKELQEKYKKFIQDYPDHEDCAFYVEKLAKNERALATMHPEYLKDNPSKKEIERICVGQFLRKIGYGKTLQERFEKMMESEDPQEQENVIVELLATAESIKKYAEKYPTLDPEYSRLLNRAAHQIFSTLGVISANGR